MRPVNVKFFAVLSATAETGVMLSSIGGPPFGITLLEAADAVPLPIALDALTVKV